MPSIHCKDLSEVVTGAVVFFGMVHGIYDGYCGIEAACTVSPICTTQPDLKGAEDMYRCVCVCVKSSRLGPRQKVCIACAFGKGYKTPSW
eukprot:3856663-Amphidinium_carterae.1